ncbi:hypothetical protein HG531_008628 [Fusarium graminearum]|nr:hypothetical protein HG531_008628 [Fusarium graminearum]
MRPAKAVIKLPAMREPELTATGVSLGALSAESEELPRSTAAPELTPDAGSLLNSGGVLSSLGLSRLGSLGSLGNSGAGAGLGIRQSLLDIDALPVTRLVGPEVLLGTRVLARGVLSSVVDNGDAAVVSIKGSLFEVGVSASPLSSSLVAVLATGDPSTHLDLHGSLGETSGALGIGSVEGSDNDVVNEPVNLGGCPLNRVLVSSAQGSRDGMVLGTVVGGSITFAKVVGLDLSIITSNPLPVDLIEVIRLKNGAGDNTLTLGSLDDNVDTAEEEVVV